MTRFSARSLWAATSLVAALAGGCSEDIAVLDGADAQGAGAGGSGAAGGGASSSGLAHGGAGGGGAGTGAGGGACATLKLAGPSVLLEPPNVGEQGSPDATLSSDDSQQATVVFQHTPYLDLYAPELAFVSFSPWGPWPAAALGPSGHAIMAMPDSFAASKSVGDSFNVLAAQGDEFVEGAWFVPRVVPEKTPPGSVNVGDAATRVAFVASAGQRHLLGLESVAGSGSSIHATPAQSNAAGQVDLAPVAFLGCASSGPMPAAAAPSDNAWLVAFANGASSPGCLDPELPGPPHAIHVVRVTQDGNYTTGAMLPLGGPIAQIEMAARSDGAWIVWQLASGGAIMPIQAVRVDLEGDVVFGPVELVAPGSEPVSFGVDRLGDDLAIAYEFAGLNARAPGIIAAIAGDNGVVSVSASLDGPILTSRPSVVGAPAGDGMLVAFGLLNDHPEVAVARFDCASEQ